MGARESEGGEVRGGQCEVHSGTRSEAPGSM
jgi:hypothetical protein